MRYCSHPFHNLFEKKKFDRDFRNQKLGITHRELGSHFFLSHGLRTAQFSAKQNRRKS